MAEKPKAVMGTLKGLSKGKELIVRIAFPGEDANKLFEWFGGFPDEGESRWFGIAHIDEAAAKAHMIDKTKKTEPKVMTDAQRAISGSAVCCKAPPFWRWINEEQDYHKPITSEEEALEWVRLMTGVESRSEYKANENARNHWLSLSKQYHAWAAQPEEDPYG